MATKSSIHGEECQRNWGIGKAAYQGIRLDIPKSDRFLSVSALSFTQLQDISPVICLLEFNLGQVYLEILFVSG